VRFVMMAPHYSAPRFLNIIILFLTYLNYMTAPTEERSLAFGNQGGRKQYIIFTDCDEDDTMAITVMAIQQALYNGVDILGIVVEDGFLPIDQGLHWLSYWMQSLFPQLDIPLVRGYPRDPYLNQTRYFPPSWVSEYTGLLDTYYPLWSSVTPKEHPLESFMKSLLSSADSRGDYNALSIGPTTTLPRLLELYPDFRKRVTYAIFDLGSISPHLIYPGTNEGRKGKASTPWNNPLQPLTLALFHHFIHAILPTGVPSPNTSVDTTWNAFMNPDGLSKVSEYIYSFCSHILITVDPSHFVVLGASTGAPVHGAKKEEVVCFDYGRMHPAFCGK
jgi:hypothetical protein